MFDAPTSSRVPMLDSLLLQHLLAHATWAAVTARALESRVALRHRAFANWWNAASAAGHAAEVHKSTALDGTHE